MEPLSIPPFIDRVAARYASFRNIVSKPLRETWQQIGETFNAHILGDDSEWSVLQPAPGTGKSLCVEVCAAMLSSRLDCDHPGMLVVKRRIDEANALADGINETGTRRTAIAYHSESPAEVRRESLREFPVVVITHEAYKRARDPREPSGNPWRALGQWQGGERRLIIIDEAIGLVSTTALDVDDLRLLMGALPDYARREAAGDVRIIESVIARMSRARDADGGCRGAVHARAGLLAALGEEAVPYFGALREAMRRIPFEVRALKREDAALRRSIRRSFEAMLDDLGEILGTWAYEVRQGKLLIWSTARPLLSATGRGAVVLDATASSAVTYDLLGARLLRAPQNARRYDGLIVKVCDELPTGKNYWRENAKARAPKVLASIARDVSPDSHVLVCSHKCAKPQFVVGDDFPCRVSNAHWHGDVTGSNDYAECDTAVLIGLPHRPDRLSVGEFFALQEVQSTAWLEGGRSFGKHPDICKAIRRGNIVVNVVQAISRTRSRRVIDARGNCAPTVGYLMLPAKDRELADAIKDGIQRHMPGVQFEGWTIDDAPVKGRKEMSDTTAQARVVALLETLLPGSRVTCKEVCERLGLSRRTMERLRTHARKAGSTFADALATLSVTLAPQAGRGAAPAFVKA